MVLCAAPVADDRRPAFDPTLCSRCEKRTNQAANPRSRMPRGHAVSTAESILIRRLDDRLEAIAGIVHEHMAEYADADLCESLAIRIIQELQSLFFPMAFSDGPPYQADPSGRIDAVRVGLFSRRPAEAPYVRAVIEAERQKAAGKLKTPSGESLLTDGELCRLAARRERREARQVSAV